MGKHEEKCNLEDPGRNGMTKLTHIPKKWDGRGAEWINLARDKGKAVAHTVENHRVSYNAENSLTIYFLHRI